MKAVGAISVKSYNQPRREQRQQILAGAREVGIMVVPEGGSLFEMNMTMVVDGHTTIEHTIPVPNIYEDVLDLWPPRNVAYTPTLLVGYGGLWGENYWYQKTNVWENPRLSKFVPPFILDPRSRRRTMAPDDEFNHFNIAKIAANLEKSGVLVNTGAHGQREGLGGIRRPGTSRQPGSARRRSLRHYFPRGPLAIGQDLGITPVRLKVGRSHIPALSATDSCRDRLGAFYHWNDRPSLDVAVAIALRHRLNLKLVRAWSDGEGASRRYEELKKELAKERRRKRQPRPRPVERGEGGT